MYATKYFYSEKYFSLMCCDVSYQSKDIVGGSNGNTVDILLE